jgi:hypothetical protein
MVRSNASKSNGCGRNKVTYQLFTVTSPNIEIAMIYADLITRLTISLDGTNVLSSSLVHNAHLRSFL